MKQTKNTPAVSATALPLTERESANPATFRRCTCCGRRLPLSAFYVSARTGRPDSRCKDCRRATSRLQRCKDACADTPDRPRTYLVITEVTDPALRLALIRRALRRVAESKARKRRREEEF